LARPWHRRLNLEVNFLPRFLRPMKTLTIKKVGLTNDKGQPSPVSEMQKEIH
jgi:hypothetical protein